MISILLDHPRFFVINKPPGIGMHQEASEAGIVSLVKAHFRLAELYPVHRLDKITSGALILAKDPDANSILSGEFRARRVEKYYLALSDQRPKKKQGLVVGDMERSRRSSWKLVQSRNNPAITQFMSGSFDGRLRWFLLKPATGKTHQLRVAMKSLGAPVLGDPIYGDKASAHTLDSPPDRAYLHAWAIRFSFGEERIEVVAPLQPGELFKHPMLDAALAQLGPPWDQSWPELPAYPHRPPSATEQDDDPG